MSRAAAVIVAAALVAGACHGPATATRVATTRVDLPPSYRYVPADIAVPLGATVVWTNHDNFTHSVRLTDDGGRTLEMHPGDSVSFTFTAPGLHHYECSFHTHDMQGTVLVGNAR